jgi:hypothetical protein
MTQSTTGKWLSAINTADGSIVKPDNNGWVSLTTATYVFAIGSPDADVESFNVITDATIAWSGMTVEDTNAPRNSSGQMTPGTVTDYDVSADSTWTQENPSDAYIGTSGTGWTATAATLAKTAGKGSAMIHVSAYGAKRIRLKVVVTTAGTVRVAAWGKSS